MSTAATTIVELLRRSKKLHRMAADLAEEYNISLKELAADDDIAGSNGKKPESKQPKTSGEPKKKLAKRVQQMKDYLDKNGPSTRKKILQESGIPEGTVGMLLTKFCKKLDDDKWDWNKESE